MNETASARRSFVRFGIRDLLWAMVVVGLVVTLILQRQQLAAERSRIAYLQMANEYAKSFIQRETGWTFTVNEVDRHHGVSRTIPEGE